MARTVNEEEFTARRNEILDIAQRHLDTKGYEQMSIQEIRLELGISNGAFYHYFVSKPAVLEALTQRMVVEFEQALLPIVHDPDLSALEKLQRSFLTIIRSKAAQRSFVAALLRVWYTDDNAIVRQKVDKAMVERLIPLLTMIIHQGTRESIFTTPYPDQVGEVIWSLIRGIQETPNRLLLTFTHEHDEHQHAENIVAVHTAYMDALERVLGAPSGSLYRVDAETVKMWAAALRDNAHGGSRASASGE
ncbi:MAG: TetR/AcrR family transcriptional regulator [Candidatus Methanoperedens sp.]|nr:TetR/AcrR family transcriptional regulator [Candidatus Methanoperedens sp.]